MPLDTPDSIPCEKCEKNGQHNRMTYMKSWSLQGRNQKKPLTIHLYGCNVCRARKRVAVKQTT